MKSYAETLTHKKDQKKEKSGRTVPIETNIKDNNVTTAMDRSMYTWNRGKKYTGERGDDGVQDKDIDKQSGSGSRQYDKTSRSDQRPEYNGTCNNRDCSKTTDLRYCFDCYNKYQSCECITDGCTLLTVSRYCRDCRVEYRRIKHYCESCKDVITERKWCKDCFAGFRSCAIDKCVKMVQPRFTHCWEHFQSIK